jgi:hypothetical protein
MMPPSACRHWQPDQAAQPAQEHRSYTTPRGTTICRALEDGDTLTVQAVAQRLKMQWAVVAHLVERGLLISNDGLIRLADVERFQATFVSGSVLAKEMGTSPRRMAEILLDRGVMPVVGPRVDGSRQNFYRRADVDG